MRAALGLALALVACGDPAAPTPAPGPCDAVDAPALAQGLTAAGTRGLTFRVVDAEPLPLARGQNRLWIAVDGPTRERVVVLRPWMPNHGHGTTPPRFTAAADERGLAFGPFDLFMAGTWELNLSASSPGGEIEDEARFVVCFEG